MGNVMGLLELKAARDRARAGIGRPVPRNGALAGDGRGNVYLPGSPFVWVRLDGGQGPDDLALTARTDLTDGMAVQLERTADRSPAVWKVMGRTRRVSTAVLYTNDNGVVMIDPATLASEDFGLPASMPGDGFTKLGAASGVLYGLHTIFVANPIRAYTRAGGWVNVPSPPDSDQQYEIAIFGGAVHIVTVRASVPAVEVWRLTGPGDAPTLEASYTVAADDTIRSVSAIATDQPYLFISLRGTSSGVDTLLRWDGTAWVELAEPTLGFSFFTHQFGTDGVSIYDDAGSSVYRGENVGASWTSLYDYFVGTTFNKAWLGDALYTQRNDLNFSDRPDGLYHYGPNPNVNASYLIRVTAGGVELLVSTANTGQMSGVVSLGGALYFHINNAGGNAWSAPYGVNRWNANDTLTTIYAAAHPDSTATAGVFIGEPI